MPLLSTFLIRRHSQHLRIIKSKLRDIYGEAQHQLSESTPAAGVGQQTSASTRQAPPRMSWGMSHAYHRRFSEPEKAQLPVPRVGGEAHWVCWNGFPVLPGHTDLQDTVLGGRGFPSSAPDGTAPKPGPTLPWDFYLCLLLCY